jgi:hypothetical protein
VPFTARQLDEIRVQTDGAPGRVYDVELPYRRLGRCRMSENVGVDVGARLDQVAAALSIYETRNGRAQTASQLLGAGVDLGPQDDPANSGREAQDDGQETHAEEARSPV